ncbi:BMA_0021/BMA_0022 family TOMM bacteriocin [Burkholderia seminalis]|uniref:BMA_0021/BMA_0022 family TOMM bacteriocin n=1 Tax=Burkholderia seminalis TaxID=488731 RepID=UPI001CF43A83|nr:BMA_0021/BMA_0022 family TOMM bacteriocin [Burkholderia seminalis]MCA8299977.1 BMA_0021/BMA_0022 family TOMM bacteriocin [Burkholderia seminalis]
MSKDLRLPTYEQFLEYRATVIRAIALAWHSSAFLDELEADPIEALREHFDYHFPFRLDLKVQPKSSEWTPTVNGDWTAGRRNKLTLYLPPAPADKAQFAQALAAYNANHITIME